jgi:hypothetical protein
MEPENEVARNLCIAVEQMVLQDVPDYEIRIRLGLRCADDEFNHADLIHALVAQTITLLDNAADEAGLD